MSKPESMPWDRWIDICGLMENIVSGADQIYIRVGVHNRRLSDLPVKDALYWAFQLLHEQMMMGMLNKQDKPSADLQ